MSLNFGFQEKLTKQLRRRKDVFSWGMRTFTPIFFVVSGGFYPVDSRDVFSGLVDFPTVTTTQSAESFHDDRLSVSMSIGSEHDAEFIRCRWQADRVFLSSLGQQGEQQASTLGCTEKKDTDADVHGGSREIREKVRSLTLDEYPLSAMAESIATYDSHIAGLIVGIAKKESNWGKRTPKLRGEECFNYWGYRGYGNRGITEDGYGCFEKPADAVNAIGDRLVELSHARGTTDPERMIIWKCGSSCVTHSPESVRKWISDVNLYYQQFAGVF
ncbi:MAG: hypothetical protein KBC83_01070 [Candidatus Moranbacteria bacterium]|jgi:hypothetical protein|nr:hypothetical protein [Candidatus Moranbacteria bacterium]MBP9801249.1 hypothetical protein [Candidatus Moranbacteria bacterium]